MKSNSKVRNMKIGINIVICKLENEQNHYQGELGKLFYVRNCSCISC